MSLGGKDERTMIESEAEDFQVCERRTQPLAARA